ncbi:MAG: VCBS repeat-containing protein [Phycisphaerales bacterium]|nr:MAG: VCBS repeat-containing protein [Phycisphaerales bacterium]
MISRTPCSAGVVALLLTAPVGPAALAQFSIDAAVNYAIGTQPSGMAYGDFDNDNDIDLATTIEGPDRIATLLNNGDGTYVAGATSLLPNSSSPQDLVAGDFDNNGTIDLAVSVRDPQGAVLIMSNTGGAMFSLAQTVNVGDRPRGLTVANIDGDADLDLAVANRDSATASVLTNTGGVFSAQTVAVGQEPRAAAFGDWFGDAGLDLAVTNHDDRTISLFQNNGGSFASVGTLSLGAQRRPEGIVAADLDNDSDLDLAVASNGTGFESASVFLFAGGAFSGPAHYPTGGLNTSQIAAADLDCDGLADLVTANTDSGNVSLLHNAGGGVFPSPVQMTVGTGPSELAVADFDLDGDMDFSVANRDSDNVSVMINQTCAIVKYGDVNADGVVNIDDIFAVLAAWGPCDACPEDVNEDGVVNIDDIFEVLSNWG